MKTIKKIIIVFSMLFTLLSHSSNIESAYRKHKRDAKTREQMQNDLDYNNDTKTTVIIILVCGITILLFVLISVNNEKKKEKDALLQKDKLIEEISKIIKFDLKPAIDNDSVQLVIKDITTINFELLSNKLKEFSLLPNNIGLIQNNYIALKKIENFLISKNREILLVDKYGEREGMKIYKGDYFLGMTEEQLIDSKGKPTKIETEVLKKGVKNIYIYGNKSSGDIFNFIDGKLERFKDR